MNSGAKDRLLKEALGRATPESDLKETIKHILLMEDMLLKIIL
jgi:hypothetical protein